MMDGTFRPPRLPPRAAHLRYDPRFAITLWWLRPARLIVLMIVPLYLSFLGFNFENVVPRRYIPSDDYLWGLLLLATLALGCALAAHGAARKLPAVPPNYVVPGALMAVLLAATVIAYAVWFGPLLVSPATVLQVMNAERANVRDTVSTLPGLTTLTQCGAAYVVLYVVKRDASLEGPAGWERLGLAAIFVLAVLRALVWSERLAIIEVSVAYVVATTAFWRFRSRDGKKMAAVLPLLAPLIVYLLFTGTEYFRSWRFYESQYSSIWEFSYERLATYYAVASNNGIGLLQEFRDWPQYTGRYVLEWLYQFPGIGEELAQTVGDVGAQYSTFLWWFGRPEFNNPSGLFTVVFDIGYLGSAIYFFAVGLLVGLAYKAFYRRALAGLLFYPFCFLFLLELLRFNYFAASRFIPIVGSLAIALLVVGTRRMRRPPAWAAQPGAAR